MPQKKIKTLIKKLSKDQGLSEDLIKDMVTQSLLQNTQQQSERIQKLMIEKERLEQDIKAQTHELQELRHETFTQIEASIHELYKEIDPLYLQTLSQLKLESIDLLNILSEVVESAFIAAIENNEHIELAFKEISRDVTYKTLKTGYLTLERAQHVVQTIMEVAINFSQATPNLADEILKGSISGSKQGLTQAIRLFKEQFAFLPEQSAPKQIKSMQQTYEDLQNVDTLFIQAINKKADISEDYIKQKIAFILEHMRPELSELVNISKETLLLVGDRLSSLGKKVVVKGEQILHSKAASEAKRMGLNVWDLAKGAMHNAKDALDQKKQSKK